jgi:hypothetical protein
MKIKEPALGNPVGARTSPAPTSQIVLMMTIADIAMTLWRAQEAVANAKHAYRLSIEQYESEHGPLAKFIRKDDPDHAAVRDFTAAKYAALQQARRRVNAIRTRMNKACSSLARSSAAAGQGGAL